MLEGTSSCGIAPPRRGGLPPRGYGSYSGLNRGVRAVVSRPVAGRVGKMSRGVNHGHPLSGRPICPRFGSGSVRLGPTERNPESLSPYAKNTCRGSAGESSYKEGCTEGASFNTPNLSTRQLADDAESPPSRRFALRLCGKGLWGRRGRLPASRFAGGGGAAWLQSMPSAPRSGPGTAENSRALARATRSGLAAG